LASDMHPPISHRYLAVRSGIGHFGYSGNIITKEYGSAIVLASVVTDAELIPTDPLPEEENYCDECRLCLSVCSSGYVDPIEKVAVTLVERSLITESEEVIAAVSLFAGALQV